MKKMIMAAVIVCAVAFSQAASVAWTGAGMTNYAGDQYYLFIVGQNGVESTATITALLDAGSDVSSYAFGSGKVAANGSANGNATGTIGAGTYTSFMVLLDGATADDASNYVLIAGGAKQTVDVGASTAKATFAAMNVSEIVNNTANWKSYGGGGGDVPEPTSGLLLLIGGAMLALRRKQK